MDLWRTAIGAVAVVDVVCDRKGWPTLSKTIRHSLHTDHPAGKAAFASLMGVAVWHILSGRD